MSHPEESDLALVVVDHGSRIEDANAVTERVAGRIRERAQGRYAAVLAAHMELASPSIDDAFARAVAAGARTIVVLPLFLFPGRHSQEDVPRLVATAAARHPGLRTIVAAPLGDDPALAELLLARADAARRASVGGKFRAES